MATHRRHWLRWTILSCGMTWLALAGVSAQAADPEIHVTRQYGLPYIPLMVMEHEQLLDKHLKMAAAKAFGADKRTILDARTVSVMKDHPKWVEAWLAAQEEANDFVTKHPREAAAMYLAMTQDKKLSPEDLVQILTDRDVRISVTPFNTMVFARYMHDTGSIKRLPASWKDYFWPVAHKFQGS